MNKQSRIRLVVIAGALMVVSTVIYAVFTFNTNTSSQPTTTLATFAFSKTDLSSSGVYAYRPWFENGAWQGDLIQYYVCGMDDENNDPPCNVGTLKTDAQVGSNPPTATGSNWMARATFAAKETADSLYWQEKTDGRHIFTVSNGSQVDFTWDKLSVAQKLALDPDTADPNDNFTLSTSNASVATGSAYDSPVLNFLRGDHSLEKSQTGGIYRIRYSLLGDIINSAPVYIGGPTENFTFGDFSTFKANMAGRSPRIAVGANDGALHVFDAATGAEVYAYIPSMLIIDPDATLDSRGYPVNGSRLAVSKLNELKLVPYDHTYFVDGQLTSASAQVGGTWKTVLAGGLGAGAKGLFALDVSYATASGNKALFEKTGANIGHIHGHPTIARLSDGKWYLISGNGFGSTSGGARLLLIKLDPPYAMTSIPACETTDCAVGEAPGLAAPALVDINGDDIVDLAFAGDDHGDMWRFDLENKTATKIFDGSADQPITAAPELGFHPDGGYMVYFGTGTVQHSWSPSGSYPTQAIYGIWDRPVGEAIVEQTLASDTPDFDNTGQTVNGTACPPPPTDPPPFPIRYMESESPVDFVCAANDATCAKGWMVPLNKPGEQVLGSPKLRAGRLTVVTNGPGDNHAGDNWLISLDYLTGGDGGIPVFNTNRADGIDDCDIQTGGELPVGLGYGTGNVSQHTIVRIAPGADINYVNTLQIPVLLSNTLLGGHLDVETDSPYGGTTAPNTNSAESEGYNVTTNDGRGFGIDGHFHQYDDANNVTYVDLFQLEPERGNASFLHKPVDLDGGSCPAGSIAVGSGCLEAVTPELNRAYDTLTDPNAPESEVYGDSSKNLLADDKKFIIVVANADLSPGATLQIGCRNWNIKDYQDMLTEQLEANVSPDNLKDYATYSDMVNNQDPRTSTTGTLVFTLSEIAGERGGTCSDLSPATVRVKFNSRSILDGGVVGTRAQCVLGLHDYRDKVCYSDSQVLGNAPDSPFPVGYDNSFSYSSCNDDRFASESDRANNPTLAPPSGYIRDPARNLHITESLEGQGGRYRWRNGALTLQFIDVSSFAAGSDCTATGYNSSCPLQDPNTLPKSTSGKKKRFGGTFAKAFKIDNVGGKDVVTSTDTSGNGLLYESTIFWHYSNLADNLRRADPASIPCYGDSNYNSALTQELGGLTLGEFNKLLDPLGDISDPDSLYGQYLTALENLQQALDGNGDLNQALLELGQLLADNPELQAYDRYKEYAPGHIPDKFLPPDLGGSGGGGTPVDDSGVTSGPPGGRQSLGPNLTAGRRSWIDLSD